MLSACNKEQIITKEEPPVQQKSAERICCNNTVVLSTAATSDSTYIVGNPVAPSVRGINKTLIFTNTSFSKVTTRLNVTLTFSASTPAFGVIDSIYRFRLQTLNGVTLSNLSQPFWNSQKTFQYDVVLQPREVRKLLFNTEYGKVTGTALCYFTTTNSCKGISRILNYIYSED